MKYKNNRVGFALTEILLVIAIMAILAGIVIVAINPARQLAQARNGQRTADLNSIDGALKQYFADNRVWPNELNDLAGIKEICDTGALNGAEDCINLANSLVPKYLNDLPKNPGGQNYKISKEASNKFGLGAPGSMEQNLNPVLVGTRNIGLATSDDGQQTTYAVTFDSQGGSSVDPILQIYLLVQQ